MSRILSKKHDTQGGFSPYRNRVRITSENQDDIITWSKVRFTVKKLKKLSPSDNHLDALPVIREWMATSTKGEWAYYSQCFYMKDPRDLMFFKLRWS